MTYFEFGKLMKFGFILHDILSELKNQNSH